MHGGRYWDLRQSSTIGVAFVNERAGYPTVCCESKVIRVAFVYERVGSRSVPSIKNAFYGRYWD